MSWRFVILPVSFLCTLHLPWGSSSTLPISDPVCTLMTPSSCALSSKLSPEIQVPTSDWHTRKCMCPNGPFCQTIFPRGLYFGKLMPPIPSSSSQPNTWLSSFLLPFPLPTGSQFSNVWGNPWGHRFCLSAPECPVAETIPTHNRHFILSCCPHGT